MSVDHATNAPKIVAGPPSTSTVTVPSEPGHRLVLFSSNKGGVGKSILMRGIVDLNRAARRIVSAWDLDGQNASSSNFYADDNPLVGMGQDDISDAESVDWVDAMYDLRADDVMLDIPGGRTPALYTTFGRDASSFLRAIAKTGRDLVCVIPISDEEDSLEGIIDAIEHFGTSAKYVIVKNGRFGNPDDFVALEGPYSDYPGLKRWAHVMESAREHNASIVYVPALLPQTRLYLSSNRISFEEAIQDGAWRRLSRKRATVVEEWMHELEVAIAETPIAAIASKVE